MASKVAPIKHVALVGVTGVGKSTLVNVLVGSYLAKVDNDAKPCTARPQHYDTEFEGNIFRLWDTRGLNEPRELQEATSPLARFFRFLRRRSIEDRELQTFLRGKTPTINLVLFCVEAKDISSCSPWKNYGKVYKKFCKKKIKIMVVVTQLDHEVGSMDWRSVCIGKLKEVVGGSPELGEFIETVPIFHRRPEDMQDSSCRDKILRLISILV